MAIIRQRKKNLIISGIIGAIIIMIPCSIIIIICNRNLAKSNGELISIKKEISGKEADNLYIIGSDRKKGDKILEDDLIECRIYSNNGQANNLKKEEIIGKSLKIDIGANTAINENMLCDDNGITDDVRMHTYNFIELNESIVDGNYVDIRIIFPNGEDYIVSEHKRIVKRGEQDITFYVSEEDILMLSGAQVDIERYAGTKVYAILYADDFQNSAYKDYPVNDYVRQLATWNPNLISKIFNKEQQERRNKLEEHLQFYSENVLGENSLIK